MLIAPQYLYNHGYRVSADQDAQVTLAIETAELYTLKSAIGATVYASLLAALPTDVDLKYWNARKGTSTMAGLESAIAHLAFANVLNENLNATRFGSVKKTSDDSTQAGADEIYRQCLKHTTIFIQYLEEVADFLGIKLNDIQTIHYEYL